MYLYIMLHGKCYVISENKKLLVGHNILLNRYLFILCFSIYCESRLKYET